MLVESPTSSAALPASPVTAPTSLPPRVLGDIGITDSGPLLIYVAALHGNEPAGIDAFRRVHRALSADRSGLQGRLVGLIGNRQALAMNRRFMRHDLNRIWTADRLRRARRARRGEVPLEDEERELRELDGELSTLLAAAKGPVTVLDVHTISGPGPAFAILDDIIRNRRLALELPVPLVLGLEEELPATLSYYLNSRGVTVLGFEAGQHQQASAIDRAEEALWIALEASGVLRHGRTEVVDARKRLRQTAPNLPSVVEVRYRHDIEDADNFQMDAGFASFQPVAKGERLAADCNGPVTTPESGLLLMPLYQELGDDGFFVVRSVRRIWLRIATILRRLHLDRALHLLPGIRRHPERPDTFLVNRRIARFLATQVFHLLGFRREGRTEDQLVFTLRR